MTFLVDGSIEVPKVQKAPSSEELGAWMLDIEIYLDILELIHATAGGEGVQVLFRILSGHSKGPELLVNAQFPHPLIAACAADRRAMGTRKGEQET